MSTEVLDGILESFRTDLMEYINDEIFDMLDEFTDDEIANLCIRLASEFLHGRTIKITPLFSNKSKRGYCLKVSNNHKGFVSVSNDESTGVSNTEYYPFFKDEEDGYFAGLCSLADMINEAWYLCNN